MVPRKPFSSLSVEMGFFICGGSPCLQRTIPTASTTRLPNIIPCSTVTGKRRWSAKGWGCARSSAIKGVNRVLDASCGAGAQAVPLAQLNFEVVAADPSTGMLRKAVEIANQYKVRDKMHFVRSDFLDLPKAGQGTVRRGRQQRQCPAPSDRRSTRSRRRCTFSTICCVPAALLVIGMRDFAPFMEDRPQFYSGAGTSVGRWQRIHHVRHLGMARRTAGTGATEPVHRHRAWRQYSQSIKRRVVFRPLSTDEVKVVLLEAGFERYYRSTRPHRARAGGAQAGRMNEGERTWNSR